MPTPTPEPEQPAVLDATSNQTESTLVPPTPAAEERPEETAPSIYLGTDGAYHDATDENRERFPAAEDTAPEDLAVGVPGETAPPPGTTPTDAGAPADGGTLNETGSDGTPVTPEPAPKAATRSTRSTK